MNRRGSGIPTPAHSARIHKVDGSQAITASTNTTVALGAVTHKTGSYISTATANSLTAVVGGLFTAAGSAYWSAGASAEKVVAILVNGTAVRQWSLTTGPGRFGGNDDIVLNANDVVTLRVFTPGSGASVTGFNVGDNTALLLAYRGPTG